MPIVRNQTMTKREREEHTKVIEKVFLDHSPFLTYVGSERRD